MGTSIELLVVGTKRLSLNVEHFPFAVLTSYPPRSHRGSSSLWQSEFDRKGGTLVHVGDPSMLRREGFFWAYEILEEIEMRRYRFLPKCKAAFFRLLQALLEESRDGEIVLTSDAQFGPRPMNFRRIYKLESVKRMHDKYGLRLNSSMRIGN
jgi:hypothetical protein